ncbi:MAG: right-handed parallel beta-helix repeat-containing protein, partial [Lentisphaerae bacterium]|nr:right-handed parallel beta-helix repeat-containing protein [Lentisphaerota bacterium]
MNARPLRPLPSILLILPALAACPAFAQGPLTPPGPPAPSMKTLEQIEPRTAITSLPYTVSSPGGYYLTGNLTGTNGIRVEASHVDIDLHGFTLRGAGGGFAGCGVATDTMGMLTDVAVRNGHVSGWPQSAVALNAGHCRVTGLTCVSNGMGGVTVGAHSLVSDCTIRYSGADNGISAGNGSVIRHCAAAYSDNSGIQVDQGCLVRGCTVYANLRGVYAGDGSSVIDCTALQNSEAGIQVSNGAHVERCTARGNGGQGIETDNGSSVLSCTVRENDGDGIQAGSGCTIRGCTVSGNVNNGILAYNDCVIANNTCRGNAEGLDNRGGIHVSYAERTRITDNHVSGSYNGIRVRGEDNIVSGNVAVHNTLNHDFLPGNRLDLLFSEVPDTISWPARVTLTGTLACTTPGANGITILSDNVTLDLGGHALIGPGADSGDGVHASDTVRNVTVRNGYVMHWRGESKKGVLLTAQGACVDGVHAVSNGFGIFVNEAATVTDSVSDGNTEYGFYGGKLYRGCRALRNGDAGYRASAAVFADCEALWNTGCGFEADGGACLRGCTASWNDGGGYTLSESVLDACAAAYNGTNGITAAPGSVVRGCSSSWNRGHGIDANGYCLVENNLCHHNGDDPYGADVSGAGIRSSGYNRIDGNMVSANDWGIRVDDGGPLVIRNSASWNPPVPAAGSNYVGHAA